MMTPKEQNLDFQSIMAEYKEPVYWHIRRLVVSHEDAQDATQETFVRIFRSLPGFKGECPLRPWIYRIATHEAIRILNRRRNNFVAWDNASSELNLLMADEYVDYGDWEVVRLQQAILSLPAKQRLAFSLRYYDELAYEEIAAVTGTTTDCVKQNFHIAKKKIIRYMKLKP